MKQTSAWDLVVVGGAYTDYVIQGPKIPEQGETTLGNKFLELPGSKASNQAVAAARLGARVAFVACVGDDRRGDEIIASLKDEGVDTHYVVRTDAEPTGMSLIHVNEKGRKQMMVALGACHHLSIADVERASMLFDQTKVLSTQLEIPLEVAMAAMRWGREASACVLFDPAPGAPVPLELFALVDIIKPDTKEAQTLTGIEVQDRETARQAAQQLLRRGVREAVVVQAGEQGDLIVWQDGECWLPRIPVNSVDTTGAGDTLAGALAVALAEGRTWTEAGPFASAAAALTTAKLGARPALPRRQDVIALLAQRQKHV
jgi:ribokinase